MAHTPHIHHLSPASGQNFLGLTNASGIQEYRQLYSGDFTIGADVRIKGQAFADVIAGVAPAITATPPSAPVSPGDTATLIRQYDDLVRVWYRTAGTWAHAFDILDKHTRFISSTGTVYNYALPPAAPLSDPFPGLKATGSVLQEEYANTFVWWVWSGVAWVNTQIHRKEISVSFTTIPMQNAVPTGGIYTPEGDAFVVPSYLNGLRIREWRAHQRVVDPVAATIQLYKAGVVVPFATIGPSTAPWTATGLILLLTTNEVWFVQHDRTGSGAGFGLANTLVIY